MERGAGREALKPGMILVLTGVMFLNLLGRTVFSPFLLVIEEEFALSHRASTQFFFLISLGYGIGMLASGYLSRKITYRGTICTAMLTGGICLVFIGLSRSLYQMRLALLFLGGGFGLYLPSGLAAVRETTSERNLGKAFSIHEIGPNLTLVLAPLYAQVFISRGSWRAGLLVLGVLCILYTPFVFLSMRGFRSSGEGYTLKNLSSILLSGRFWIMALFFSLAIGASLGAYSVLPAYLVTERGMDMRTVNTYIGISRVSGIAGLFFVGLLVGRFGVRRVLFVVMVLSGLITALLGLPVQRILLFALFLQPIIIVCFFPVALTQTAGMWPVRSYNIAISLMIPVSLVIGAGVIPMFMGVLGDAGRFGLGLELLGGLVFLCAWLVYLLKVGREPGKAPV